MTHPKQDNGLLEIFQKTNESGDDALQTIVEHIVQRILEEELTAFLQAETYERTKDLPGTVYLRSV